MDAKETVNNYLNLYFSGNVNPEELRRFLTEDLHFEGPLMRADSQNEFIDKLRVFGGTIQAKGTIHEVIAEGNTVVARYDFILGDKSLVPTVEWYQVREGKIAKMYMYCDPRPFI